MEALAREAYYKLLRAVGAIGKLYDFRALGVLKVVRGHLNLSKDDHDEILSLVEADPIVRTTLGAGAADVTLPRARNSTLGLGLPPYNTSAAESLPSTPLTFAKGGSPHGQPAPQSSTQGANALVGRSFEKFFPDRSPPWVRGVVKAAAPGGAQHLVEYGPPLKFSEWISIHDLPPDVIRWIPPGQESVGKAAAGSRASQPKASPAAPKSVSKAAAPASSAGTPKGPTSPPVTPSPGLGMPPYKEAALSQMSKAKKGELQAALTACDSREAELIGSCLDLVTDPETIAEVNQLLQESQRLAQQEAALANQLMQQWRVGA